MREMHREPEVPEEEVPVVECLDGLVRITLKELAITHFVKGGTLQNANLPQVLRDMGFAGGRNLAAWTRTDMGSRTHNEVPGTHSIGGPRDIQTILVFEAPNTRSPSPILQDFVRLGAREF